MRLARGCSGGWQRDGEEPVSSDRSVSSCAWRWWRTGWLLGTGWPQNEAAATRDGEFLAAVVARSVSSFPLPKVLPDDTLRSQASHSGVLYVCLRASSSRRSVSRASQD